MREIKFRAWDKRNKKWLLGYDSKHLGGFNLVGECVILGEFSALFRPLERLNEIDITQFTGLKDKNGKEIYEGDIVKFEQEFKAVVKFEGAEFLCVELDGERSALVDILEVVGNIYENPELVKP